MSKIRLFRAVNYEMKKSGSSKVYKVLLVGPYPGRIGGVSIFIKRLHNAKITWIETYVLNTQNFSVSSENVFSLKYSLKLILNSNLVHINISNLNASLLVCLVSLLFCLVSRCLRKKVIVQIHSMRYETEGIRKLKLKLILHLAHKVIVVNTCIYKKILESYPNFKNKTLVIPPFIKPDEREPSSLPVEILSLREKVSNLIVANAFKIVFYRGNDLYGLGLSIDMFNKIASHFPETGFVFVVSVPTEEMHKIVSEHEVHKNFLLYGRPVDFISLLKISDLFVRPTFSDGDSLSVREALSIGVPTIASNVVERPESVILFDVNNPDDYLNKVADVLKNADFYRKKFIEVANKQKDYVADIKNLYLKVLNKEVF